MALPSITNTGITRSNEQNVTELEQKHAPNRVGTDNETTSQAFSGPPGGQSATPSLPSQWRQSSSEQGHGGQVDKSPPPPSPAQLEYERKVKEREDVIKQNAANSASNSMLHTQIGKLETIKTHLSALAQVWDLSASFTRAELNDFTNSATLSPEIKAAARWLLSQSDADLAALGLRKGEGGVTKDSINTVLGSLDTKIADLRTQLRPEVPVPGEPTPPAPPSSASSSTGTGGTNGAGTTPTGQNQPNNGTSNSSPTRTPEQGNADMYPTFSQLPEFSSSATTGEGRMLDASIHVQKGLDALEKDLALAAADGNQGKMTAINNQIAKLQAGMSALMQMMKQRQEMETNMSKMFSDMAMSAIRNMR